MKMPQLFGLQAAPWEQRDLAADPADAETLQSLRTEFLRLRNVWDDRQSHWGQTFWEACRI
jgi:hypothetical protein